MEQRWAAGAGSDPLPAGSARCQTHRSPSAAATASRVS